MDILDKEGCGFYLDKGNARCTIMVIVINDVLVNEADKDMAKNHKIFERFCWKLD